MEHQDDTNYQRIAQAIVYIKENFKNQPELAEIAEKVHLSPFHFQRLFTEWAGVSPKKFLQYISIAHAKELLKDKRNTLFDATHQTGLSGTGRLHDLFIKIEAMTPGEYKNGGQALVIHYETTKTPFGDIFVASTPKGICYMAFADTETAALAELQNLQKTFPNASLKLQKNALQESIIRIFSDNWEDISQIKLHLKGTDFQLKVWEALLKIPMGELKSYGDVADSISQKNASRAVGTAVGSNQVAFLIPCHRVIQASGVIGEYKWGSIRKTALIGWEQAKTFF